MSRITDFKFSHAEMEFTVAVVTPEQWTDQHLERNQIRPAMTVAPDGTIDEEKARAAHESLDSNSPEHRRMHICVPETDYEYLQLAYLHRAITFIGAMDAFMYIDEHAEVGPVIDDLNKTCFLLFVKLAEQGVAPLQRLTDERFDETRFMRALGQFAMQRAKCLQQRLQHRTDPGAEPMDFSEVLNKISDKNQLKRAFQDNIKGRAVQN